MQVNIFPSVSFIDSWIIIIMSETPEKKEIFRRFCITLSYSVKNLTLGLFLNCKIMVVDIEKFTVKYII